MFVLTVTVAIIDLFVVGMRNLLLDLTGVMYPMYATILAVESPRRTMTRMAYVLAYFLLQK